MELLAIAWFWIASRHRLALERCPPGHRDLLGASACIGVSVLVATLLAAVGSPGSFMAYIGRTWSAVKVGKGDIAIIDNC